MSPSTSTLFSVNQLKGLEKLGDIMMPSNQSFPSFSESGCIASVDTAMGSAHPDDIRDFGYFLLFCRYAPPALIKLIIQLADNANRFPTWLAPLLRTLNIGIKGVVISLYYSGQQGFRQGSTPLEAIDYSLTCDTTDL